MLYVLSIIHTFANHFFEQGIELKYVQELLGHSSSKITEIDSPHDYIISKDILHQNYPNPFSNSTTISFNLATNSHEQTRINIYNINEQLVKQFKIQSPIKLGTKFKINEVVWEGKDDKENELSSGIYFYKLSTQDKVFIKKMILLR